MHYSKLTERKEHLQKMLKDFHLDSQYPIKWLEDFDRERMTLEIVTQNYHYNPRLVSRPLTIPEIANGMAHNYIIKEIATHNQTALILEDDIIFKPNFTYALHKLLKDAPSDWEILSIGGYYDDKEGSIDNKDINTPIPLDSVKLINPVLNTSTTSCYILSHKGAKKLMSDYLYSPFSAPIDHTFTFSIPRQKIKVYSASPRLAYEGSKTDLFSTTLLRGF